MSINLLILISCLATFFWRAAGVWFGNRVRVDSAAFRFVTGVAYAVVGALIFKLVVYPQGATAQTTMGVRFAAVAVALAVYFLTKRNVSLSAWAGAGALFLLVAADGQPD